MDSTLLFLDDVDLFFLKYIIWLDFVLFYLMVHLYRRCVSNLATIDSSIIIFYYKTKLSSTSIGLK